MIKIIKLVVALTMLVSVHAKANKTIETAIFSGGCFWCMEKPFDDIDGVLDTTPGYTGGHTKDPSYETVSQGATGHFEAIQVSFDPDLVSYQELLDVFWKNIDPTNGKGQFCDNGAQYRSAIFYMNNKQNELAVKAKQNIERLYPLLTPVRTLILPAKHFYAAERLHQNYYLKNPWTYKFYRYTCGRDQRLKELWG